jgi:hypothetical protein
VKKIVILVIMLLLFCLIKVDAQSPKKGVGATYEDCQGLRDVNATWFYNWGYDPPLCDGVEAVPMLWCTSTIGQELGGNSQWVMGANEPDVFNQCNKSAKEMATAWRRVEEAYPDRLLVSPGVMWVPWLRAFKDAYLKEYGRPPTIHAAAVHCYAWVDEPQQAVEYCKQQVSAVYALGFGQVWVTEWAWMGADFQKGLEYMVLMRAWMEQDARIDRYAWFELSYRGDEPWAFDVNTSLVGYYSGAMTDYGRAYRGFYRVFLPDVVR